MSVLVKVCGMTSKEDALLCASKGASFLGFIFHPPSPRCVDIDFVRSIELEQIRKTGVFVKQSAAEVLGIMKNGRLDFAQLHGGQNEEFCRTIGKERVIKVLWPQRYDSVREFQDDIDRFVPHCSYLLFDAGSSGGGHGISMDFSIFEKVEIPLPWFLAGGLDGNNLADALAVAKPDGVDLNSGVESAPGRKDEKKLSAAFACINSYKVRG